MVMFGFVFVGPGGGGGVDPGLYVGKLGTFCELCNQYELQAIMVGEMQGHRFMMPQLSGKMLDFASSKARGDWESSSAKHSNLQWKLYHF